MVLSSKEEGNFFQTFSSSKLFFKTFFLQYLPGWDRDCNRLIIHYCLIITRTTVILAEMAQVGTCHAGGVVWEEWFMVVNAWIARKKMTRTSLIKQSSNGIMGGHTDVSTVARKSTIRGWRGEMKKMRYSNTWSSITQIKSRDLCLRLRNSSKMPLLIRFMKECA